MEEEEEEAEARERGVGCGNRGAAREWITCGLIIGCKGQGEMGRT